MNRTDLLNVFRNNVADIRSAINGDTSGYVFVWSRHWLAVKFNRDVCHAVSVDRATVTHNRRDPRIFTNGAGWRAELMPRDQALRGALAHAEQILKTFEEMAAA